jgi:hypothetical protein
MIYIVTKDNNEKWEDYHKWNDSIWNVPYGIDVNKKYREHIQSKLNELDINIKLDDRFGGDVLRPYCTEDMDENSVKRIYRKFKKVIKQNSIENYLESINAIRLDFKELHY